MCSHAPMISGIDALGCCCCIPARITASATTSRVQRTRRVRRQVTCNDDERIHEHEKPRAPEQKPAEDPAAPLHEFVSNVGNRAFGGAIARLQGAGIMPNGEVHPERAVDDRRDARRRSGARRRRRGVSSARSSATCRMSACTPTRPRTTSITRCPRARSRPAPTSTSARTSTSPTRRTATELIAHELAHVVQQRGAPTSGPLVVSHPGDSWRRPMQRERRWHDGRADRAAVARLGREPRPPSPRTASIATAARSAAVERVAGSDPIRRPVPRPLHLRRGRARVTARRVRRRRSTSACRRPSRRSGLSARGRARSAVCAATELNPRYGRLYAYLQDDVTRKLAEPAAGRA